MKQERNLNLHRSRKNSGVFRDILTDNSIRLKRALLCIAAAAALTGCAVSPSAEEGSTAAVSEAGAQAGGEEGKQAASEGKSVGQAGSDPAAVSAQESSTQPEAAHAQEEETVTEIKRRLPEIRIILTTSALESTWEDRARAIGVEGFWYKEYEVHSLIEMMNRVMNGETVYPFDPPDLNLGNVKRSDLTDRELEVLRELTGGLTNEEIAEKLSVTVFTIKRHIQNMLQKTGYKNRLDLAINAKTLGLVVSEEERTRGNAADSCTEK